MVIPDVDTFLDTTKLRTHCRTTSAVHSHTHPPPLPPHTHTPHSLTVTPLHWIYDQAKVQGLVDAGTAEFSQTSHCPFYTLETGQQSAYGDQVNVVLKSVAEKKGESVSCALSPLTLDP